MEFTAVKLLATWSDKPHQITAEVRGWFLIEILSLCHLTSKFSAGRNCKKLA
jgi:hypothetical protein